ncbi:hypothetical protein K6T82_13450 [Flavobacterium sp. 17A]|uniref:Uncharacterized protein n=1 Tax=Flavobacterium potami TaxID=2872310 RepID=A0A9X1HC54_9FLAO|nr:hypothetical protein [Flavobacterium potami]MBZ4035779.1 hypothetical protein [Flavobacterium potami]
MKKSILILITLLFTSIGHANFYKVILYMEDGTKKTGFAELVKSEDSKISFKTDESAKKEKIASTEVKKIEYFDEEECITTVEALYATTANILTGKFSKSKKKLWFNVIYDKDVKIGVIRDAGTIRPNAGGTSTIVSSSSSSYFFGKKNSDALVFGYFTTANTVGAIGTESLLRKMSREAFSDCPKLIEAIGKEDFKLRTLLEQLVTIFDKEKCK